MVLEWVGLGWVGTYKTPVRSLRSLRRQRRTSRSASIPTRTDVRLPPLPSSSSSQFDALHSRDRAGRHEMVRFSFSVRWACVHGVCIVVCRERNAPVSEPFFGCVDGWVGAEMVLVLQPPLGPLFDHRAYNDAHAH